MSDSEDSDVVDPRPLEEIHKEIKRCKKNPTTSTMFVSGWDDADDDVAVVSDPKGRYNYGSLKQILVSIICIGFLLFHTCGILEITFFETVASFRPLLSQPGSW